MSESKLLKLPAITKFLTEISEDMENGVNSIVFMPNKVTNKVFDTLKYILREESNCEILRVELNGKKPLDLIFERFIKNPSLLKNENSLVDNIDVSKYLFLNLCNISSELSQLWFDFLSKYSISCTSKDRNQRLKFCFVVDQSNALSNFPDKSPALSHYLFYNYLSDIDFHYCLESAEDLLEPLDYELFKSLLYELAFPNIELVFNLMNDIKGFISNPIQKIRDYINHNIDIEHATAESDKILFVEKKSKDNLTVNHKLFRLWLMGLVRYRDKEYEPSTLALLISQKDDLLSKRVWLAQMKVLFPLIEKNRLIIINWIKDNIEEEIYLSIINKKYDESDIVYLEIGPLYYLTTKLKIKNIRLKELTCICKTIRNSLAHFTPVSEVCLKEFAKLTNASSIIIEDDSLNKI